MKLKHRLGLLVAVAALATLTYTLTSGVPGNAAVGEYSCYCSQPSLSLTQDNVYWGSYADYTARSLSIDYNVSNNSTNYANAHNLQILTTSNTGGVVSTNLGRNINMVSAGECELVTVKYNVPSGVGSFNTTVYATTKDQCGTQYNYPGPSPTP